MLLNFYGVNCVKCLANKLKIKSIDLKLKVTKNLASSNSYTPIKIGFDFTSFTKPSSMSSSTFSQIKAILKETRKEFSKILQVQHENIYLTNFKEAIMTNCGINTIANDY